MSKYKECNGHEKVVLALVEILQKAIGISPSTLLFRLFWSPLDDPGGGTRKVARTGVALEARYLPLL